MRAQVIAIRAHLEVEIDFSDEDIRLPSRREVAAEIERLLADVAILHDSFARGMLIREGVRATIIGKPNAGKSSLLNLLLGADRAIVTAIAGTTRDVIEDSVQLGPYALVLNDTAGVRESADDVERIGIERTIRSARDADLLIATFDSSRPLESSDLDVIRLASNRPGLAILNKRDLPAAISADDLRRHGLTLPILPFSAINVEEAATLRAELTRAIAALVDPVRINHRQSNRDLARASSRRARDGSGSPQERPQLRALPDAAGNRRGGHNGRRIRARRNHRRSQRRRHPRRNLPRLLHRQIIVPRSQHPASVAQALACDFPVHANPGKKSQAKACATKIRNLRAKWRPRHFAISFHWVQGSPLPKEA